MATYVREWFYLNREGIGDLHGQMRGKRIIERTDTKGHSTDKSLKGTGGLNAFVARAEVAGEARSGQKHETVERAFIGDESLLLELEAHLVREDALENIACIRRVAELSAKEEGRYVTGILRFRWAPTSDPSDPVKDATKNQMFDFEVDKEAYNDASMLAIPIRMGGSLRKCVGVGVSMDGSLPVGTHVAQFLRQIAQNPVPLGFLAWLQPYPKLIHLRPYAIWFP